MGTIKYNLSDPETWYLVLEEQLPGCKKDNQFIFDRSFGIGQLEYFVFQSGLWAQQMNFTLKENLILSQLPTPMNNFFNINFYMSNAHIKLSTEDKLYEFAFDNVSIMLTSSTSKSKYEVPANENVRIFQIGFTRDWLLSNAFGEKSKTLKQIFKEDRPIYFSENLDYKFKYLLEELDLRNSNRLSSFSSCLQLLNSFFENLEKRNFDTILNSNIHHFDLEQIIKVRNYMDDNPLNEISLEQLSQIAGMSLSKFKRLFKKVFGLTPYRYYLKNKMEIAMEILLKEKYSVSETGFIVGYSNLSQFSKAFKNHFGKLPSEVRS